jgi:hypothetical protein
VAFSLSVPALLGYTYLMIQAARLGTNASYDAYKLFCVFFPGILASLGLVTLLVVRGRGLARIAALALCAGVALASLRLCLLFIAQNSKPALVVDRALIELRRVDAMKEIGSLNLRVDAFWDRLWANSFLLHHEQYFATHTYEARLNTPMSGDWDLLGNFFTLSLPRPGDSKPVNKLFSLVNTRSPHYLKGELGQGWHQMERDAVTRWCWSRGDASIMLENPHSTPLLMSVRFDLLASSERNIKLLLNEELLGSTQVGTARGLIATKEFRLPPGRHFLRLTSTQSAQKPQAYDSRALGFCLYGVQVDLRED